MSSESLDNLEYHGIDGEKDVDHHLSEAEKYVGVDFYIVTDHLRDAKNKAANQGIGPFKERRLENLREEALESSISSIEDTIKELEDGPYKRDVMRELWEKLNEAEHLFDGKETPDKYHELKQNIAESSYQEIFDKSVGIINGEISIFENRESLHDRMIIAERARAAAKNAKAAEEMTDYLGEDNPADSVYFDHKEVLESMDEMAINLSRHMNIDSIGAPFENLYSLTETYGVVNSLVEKGLRTRNQMIHMDRYLGNLEDEKIKVENIAQSSAGISDKLHNLEFMIGEARRKLEEVELPDEQEERLRNRTELVEETADDCWQDEVK